MRGQRDRALAAAALVFLGVKLANLAVNLPLFPTLARSKPGGSMAADSLAVDIRARAALLVPMRNEAGRLPATLPGLLTSGLQEIVFLDDESTDGSAELVTTAARSVVGVDVRVIAGRPRPAGWAGKTWACAQLADATDAELLIYVDADVELAPGALVAVAADMDRQQADVFSVFPRQRAVTWPERLTTPLITDVVLCFLPFPLLRAPAPAAATANGSVLAFRRKAYRRLGGFAAVRAEVVEDVAIAQRTRRLGLQLGLALGGPSIQVRMYHNYREIIVGLGRGLTPAAGGRRWVVAAGFVWHLIAYTLPVVRSPWSRRWRWVAALGIVERLLVEAKGGGRDWPAALLVAASPVAAAPVVRQALRREQTWKGRTYS